MAAWNVFGVLLLVLVCCCRLLYRQYYGQQDCEMTYMYQWPSYQEVHLHEEVAAQYPQYSLHYYFERPITGLTLPLRGVPALFLPGNAGSHKQARSSASIALRMHPSDFKEKRNFDFFTVSFNEELSGMFGGVLHGQTKYVAACIEHILSLYKGVKPRPQSVVIIGHSMGGVLARGLFTLPNFNHSAITTIIALSSPLLHPVMSFDSLLHQYYDNVEEVWSRPSEAMSHVTLVSVSGGERDVMVPSHLSIVPGAINLATPAIPRNWASADHLAVVWCRRVQLALTRALFILQDKKGRDLTGNSTRRHEVLRHLLLQGKELPYPDAISRPVSEKGVVFLNRTEFYQVGFKRGYKSVATPLPPDGQLLAASDTQLDSWLYLCTSGVTLTCRDLSSLCVLLPPKSRVVKVFSLSRHEAAQLMPGATHLMVSGPTSSGPKRFVHVQECRTTPTTSLPLLWYNVMLTLPAGHCSLTNLSIPHLTQVWQSYRVTVRSDCGGVSGGLVLPWYPHTTLSNSSSGSPLTVHLSLLAPPPSHYTTPSYLLLWSSSECELELQVTSDPLGLLDKLCIIHAPLLLPWVTALCFAASIPSWSLKFEILLAVLAVCSIMRLRNWASRQPHWASLTSFFVESDAIFQSNSLTCNDKMPYPWTCFISLADWDELDVMWGGWGPAVCHLLGGGLQQMLDGAVGIATRACQICLGRYGRGLSWLLLTTGGLVLPVCSSISLLLALLALLVQARRGCGLMREASCVLVCFQLLTLPSLFSWLKDISFSLQLSPDPHRPAVLAAILLTASILYPTPRDCHRRVVPPWWWYPRATKAFLAVATLIGCLLQAHMMMGPVLVYLGITSMDNYLSSYTN